MRFINYKLFCLTLCVALLSGCQTTMAPYRPDEEWTPPEWDKTGKEPDKVWKEIRSKKIDSIKRRSRSISKLRYRPPRRYSEKCSTTYGWPRAYS